MTCSDSRMSGSASCSALKFVCMGKPVQLRSEPGVHPPRVEDALGVEVLLDPLGQGGECGGLGMKDRHGRADIRRRAQQGGTPASLVDGGTDRLVARIGPGL